MTPQHWAQTKEIFDAVVAIAPEERSAALDRLCRGSQELRAEAERLLSHHDEMGGFLNVPSSRKPGTTGKRPPSLSPGTRLGPYEVVSLLGKGGMGEVYRARDPRLNRDVAIKTSREQFNERFEREARAVASLNHPNICHLYDVGPNYLVMELVEGDTLKGPLPVDEALKIADQIALALEAAHENGIIHRDLKPANIKITPDGVVKVLDFGLARMGASGLSDPDNSPALVASTEAGTILGTAAYMAPEQARGKKADKRADIWAFGVVLYELVKGTAVPGRNHHRHSGRRADHRAGFERGAGEGAEADPKLSGEGPEEPVTRYRGLSGAFG